MSRARTGVVRTRSGDTYKPSALRSYQRALTADILPVLGHLRLSAITRHHLQDLADAITVRGVAPSTVRNAMLPLRAIYRDAKHRDLVATNPTVGLLLPAARGRRERTTRPEEATHLLEALPRDDQAVWATAMYGGLRRGELLALRWCDIDLDQGLIHVRRSWDGSKGPILPKTHAGSRRVPLPEVLRGYLISHRLRHPAAEGDVLAFGSGPDAPFEPVGLYRRARMAWKRAGLDPILLHECRHSYASFMIAAGVNAKSLSSYMGHASITITLDRYGHLLPGNEATAAALFDRYLIGAGADRRGADRVHYLASRPSQLAH